MARSGQDAQQRPLQSSGRGFGGAEPPEGRGGSGAGRGRAGRELHPGRQQPEPGVSRHISGIYSYFGLFILLTSTFK